jgi:hypothetical protein
MRNLMRFGCRSSVPITIANDSRWMDAAKCLSSNHMYHMLVVQIWVNGVGYVG